MKALTNLALVSLLVVSTATQGASSAKPAKDMNEKIDAKCFIEVVGGSEMIAFWSTTRGQLKTLPQTILGSEVHIAGKKNKGFVYKANECKELSGKFSSQRARSLDEKTPK